jgi:HD domain
MAVSEKVKLSRELMVMLERHVPAGATVTTLADGRPNWIVEIKDDGVSIETEASKEKGRGPRLVEAWMLQTAWDHLSREGSLTNKYLLSTAGLNVKRSSAVCAILAHLPGVEVVSSKPIELRYRPDGGDVVDRAFRLARGAHGDQTRKGTSIPYLAHLMSTAAIVWEHGGSDEQAAAALLHDFVEDQGGELALERLRSEFVDHPLVVEIVEGCSDAVPGPGEEKAPWVERKVAYLRHLGEKPAHVLLVSAADKLHNARSTLADYRISREELWARFNRGREYQLWYYEELARVFSNHLPGPLADELSRTVSELRRLVLDAVPSADFEVSALRARLERAMDDRESYAP